jgi:hypothetical protein
MKKYMIIAVAALFFAGATNAQNATHPGKKVPAKESSAKIAQHKDAAATTSVSPKTGKATGQTAGIKRKHHAKKKAAKMAATK